MKLRAVYFESMIPVSIDVRVNHLRSGGDAWDDSSRWDLDRADDGCIVATKGDRLIVLDGYAYTYEPEPAPAAPATKEGKKR